MLLRFYRSECIPRVVLLVLLYLASPLLTKMARVAAAV